VNSPLFLGIDVGTSGVRAIALDGDAVAAGQGSARMEEFGANHRDPAVWWAATDAALSRLLPQIEPERVRAISVDGTSGTMLPVDRSGRPLAEPLMYNDPIEDAAIVEAVSGQAPRDSAARGATSGLAKAIRFASRRDDVWRVIHQADWIAGRLSGRFDTSDENNALKTGYDPVARRWPDWIGRTSLPVELLPDVIEPGTPVAPVSREISATFGLPGTAIVVAGTTDGCASFLATGASRTGDAVTALGSTLTVKMLCDKPVFASEYGLYSHRLGALWLAGGASNTGGNVLSRFFAVDAIARLSEAIDPAQPTGLDYYPLSRKGERFPINDPDLPPRLEPRPPDDVRFLHGLFEGMARIEALGYRRLRDLGAPNPRSIRSVGGGAKNPAWSAIRAAQLGIPFAPARSEEAAAGAAMLAMTGARKAGLA
jgi:sugar (pentulose or hexulose) kinase